VTRLLTSRLILETFTAEEAAAVRAGAREGRCWAEDYPFDAELTVAAIIGEAGTSYDEDAPLGMLQVRVAATGEAIGGIGFLSSPEDGEAEVGYGLVPSARGQGYATEALRAVLELAAAQDDVRSVVALTLPGNHDSHRVLLATGFRRDGETVTDSGAHWRWVIDLDPADP
jgi:RimJ/RimL family protein N-acetyltransferase